MQKAWFNIFGISLAKGAKGASQLNDSIWHGSDLNKSSMLRFKQKASWEDYCRVESLFFEVEQIM